MSTFYAFYPPGSAGSSNSSVGTNGATAPTSSTEVGGINPGGNLQPLQTDAAGALITTPASGSVQHVIVDSSALPTGASTSALQTSGNTQLVTIASNQTNGTQVTAVNNFPATQPVSGTVTANQGTPGVGAWPTLAAQSGTWSTRTQDGSGTTISSTSNALDVNIKSSGLSNQSVNLAQVAGTTTATSNGVVGAGVQRVAIASDNTAFAVNATLQAGSALAGKVGIDQTTPGTTNAVALAQIGSTTTATGNGVVSTGVQRVAIASDNTAFAVNATLQASSAVIGHVINDAGSAIMGQVGIDQTTPGTTNALSLKYIAGTTIAAGQSAAAASVPVTLSNENIQDLYFTGQSAQTATVNNIIPASSGAAATDATGYRSGSVQVVSTGTGGTFIFEGSNDNSSFVTIPVYNQAAVSGASIVAAISATSSQLIYVFPVNFRYIRLRIATTITGGSIQAFTKLAQVGYAPFLQLTSSPVTANVNAIQSGAWFTTATATLSNVASSATTVTVLASNANRKGMMVFNDSTSVLYLKFGATASTTSYTVQIASNGYYEMPASPYMYTGICDGIWSSANGNARVTEIS